MLQIQNSSSLRFLIKSYYYIYQVHIKEKNKLSCLFTISVRI